MSIQNKKSGQKKMPKKSSSQKKKKKKNTSPVITKEMKLLLEVSKRLLRECRKEFTRPFVYERVQGSDSRFEQDDICAACHDPMKSGFPHVTAKNPSVCENVFTYHEDCFICNRPGCTHRFPDPDEEEPTYSSSGEDEKDTRNPKGETFVYLNDEYMTYCMEHIPSTSKFLVLPKFHRVTHRCMNAALVSDKWHDFHEFYTHFGFLILKKILDEKDEELILNVVNMVETNINFTSQRKIEDFDKGRELSDVATWPHKDYGFIGPYYKGEDEIDKYDHDVIRIGSQGKISKTEAEVAKLALIHPVAQHKYVWDIRQKLASEKCLKDILGPKEHLSVSSDNVSQEPGGEVNMVAAVGPVYVIPACPEGSKKLKIDGVIQQERFDAKRFSGSGNKKVVKKNDGTSKVIKKKPRADEVPAFMALKDASRENKGGMSVVFAPRRITVTSIVENEQKSEDYDWETFYMNARSEDRSPAHGIHYNSHFEDMKQFIPLDVGDILVLQRSGMYAFEQGKRTQMYAYVGFGTMDMREITKETRVLCALNEFTTPTYNTHFYVHPSGLDGMGAAGSVWLGSEEGKPPPENLSCPIGVTELYKYKDALFGTRPKSQKMPSYYVQFQPKESRFNETARKFESSSIEIAQVPKLSKSKGKKNRGKMTDEAAKSKCPVTYDPKAPLMDRINSIVTGGARKSTKKKKGGVVTYGANKNFVDKSDDYDGFDVMRFYPNGPNNVEYWVDFVFPQKDTEDIQVLMKSVDAIKPDNPVMLENMVGKNATTEPRLTAVVGKEELRTLRIKHPAVEEDPNTEAIMNFAKGVAEAFKDGSGEELDFDQVMITYYRNETDWNRSRQENFYIDPDQRCVVHFVKGGAGRVIRFRWANKGIELDLTIPEFLAKTGWFYILSPACQDKPSKEDPMGVYHQVTQAGVPTKNYMTFMGDKYEHLRIIQMHKAKDRTKESKKKSKKRKAPSKKPKTKMATNKKTTTEGANSKTFQVTRVKGSKQTKASGYGNMLNSLITAATQEALVTSKKATKGSDERHLYMCYNSARKSYRKFIASKKTENDLLQELTSFAEAIPQPEEEESSSEEEEIGFVIGGQDDDNDDEEDSSSSSEDEEDKKPAPKKKKVVPNREASAKAKKVISEKAPEAKIVKKLGKKEAKEVVAAIEAAEEAAGDGEFKVDDPEEVVSEEFEEDEEEPSSSSSEGGSDEEEDDGEDEEDKKEVELDGVEGDGDSSGEEDEEEEEEGDMNISVKKKKNSSGVSDARKEREGAFAKLEKQLDLIEQSHPAAINTEIGLAARSVVMDSQKDCEDNACGKSYLKAFKKSIMQYKQALSTATNELKEKAIAEDEAKKKRIAKKRKTPAPSPSKSKVKESPKPSPAKKVTKKPKPDGKKTTKPIPKKKKTDKSTPKKKVTATKRKVDDKKQDETKPSPAKKVTKPKPKPKKKKTKVVMENGDDDSAAAAELELLRARQARLMKEMPAYVALKTQFSALGEQVPDLAELDKDDLSMYRGARKHLNELLDEKSFQKHGSNIPGVTKALQEFEQLVKKISNKRKREPEPEVEEEKEEPEPKAMEVEYEEEDPIANYKVEEPEEAKAPNKKKTKVVDEEEEGEEDESSSEEHEAGSGAYLVFDSQTYLIAYVSEGVDKDECHTWLAEQGLDKDDYYVYFNPNNEYRVGETVVVN